MDHDALIAPRVPSMPQVMAFRDRWGATVWKLEYPLAPGVAVTSHEGEAPCRCSSPFAVAIRMREFERKRHS
jgi:hypothetical protein